MNREILRVGFLVLMVWLVNGVGWGQSIFANLITDGNPSAANPFTAGQTVNANLTVSGIGRGSGINANAGANRYNANSWNTASIDPDAYFEFTLTPNAGYEINFLSFGFTGERSGTGPTNFAFRSSLDGYTANIASPAATGATIILNGAAYQNITTSITFRLYGWGASGATGTYSVNDFTFSGMAPLPIELAFFDVVTKDENTSLTWSTATELNNDFFQIERSPDGRTFEAIGEVDGAGTSYETLQYAFTDEKPLSGWNYYRLKQVDFDGQFAYSPVRAVLMGKATANSDQLRLFPNPAANEIFIQSPANIQPGDLLEIFDQFGRLVLQREAVEALDGPLDLFLLPAGLYVARLQTEDGAATGTFLVKR